MKQFSILAVLLAAAGCGKKSEFDISPGQVELAQHGGPSGQDKLPPGAVRHEKTYHKGDVLPDGTISDGERKVVIVEMRH